MIDEARAIAGHGPIQVLLVEGHRLVREGLRLLLEHEPGMAVAGEAADGEAGLRLFARLLAAAAVDVVVADLGTPDIDGLAVARGVKALAPGTPVVLPTMHDGGGDLRGMVEAGVADYVRKQAIRRDLCPAIRVAMGRGPSAPR